MRRDAARPIADKAGFVLVMTLLLLGLVSAGAVAIMLEARAGATGVAGVLEAARTRRVAQAGAARTAYGLLVGNDPLKALGSIGARPAVWRFDGMDVAVSATAESDRIDLNEGRLELVAAVLAKVDIGQALRAELRGALTEARAKQEKLPGIAALLRPCLRHGGDLRKLENAFTVSTRASGFAPVSGNDESLEFIPSLTASDRNLIDRAQADGRSPSDDRRLRHLESYLSERSPQYRIVARVTGSGAPQPERRALVSVSLRWPHLSVANSAGGGLAADFECPDSPNRLAQ